MKMRAKFQIESVTHHLHSEVLKLSAVCGDGFGPNGESEDNSFARFTPSASLEMAITNPTLHGQFKPGQKFYVDFIPVADERLADPQNIPC